MDEFIEQDQTVFENTDPSFMETPFSKINAINIIQTPTNAEWVKDKKGLSYVSGDTVTRLLNKAFNYRWSFYILETRVVESQDKMLKGQTQNAIPQNPVVQAHGRLVVPGFGSRDQWGSQPLVGGNDVQEHAFKSASTDALKKCASMFGIALDLYGKDGIEDLKVQMNDIIFDDKVVIKKYKENMEAARAARKAATAAAAAPAIAPTVATEPTPAPVPQPVQTQAPAAQEAPPVEVVPQQVFEQVSAESLQQASEQIDVQAVVDSVVQENVPQEQVPTAQPAYMMGVPQFETEDIQRLKELKRGLGNLDNAALDVYAQEFFGIPDATHLNINPANIKDFNLFLSSKM